MDNEVGQLLKFCQIRAQFSKIIAKRDFTRHFGTVKKNEEPCASADLKAQGNPGG